MKTHLIAHLRKQDSQPQYLWTHLEEVSELAGRFTAKVGLKELGKIIGLLHDVGKFQDGFQVIG